MENRICEYCQKGLVLVNGNTTDIGIRIFGVGNKTYLSAYGYNPKGDIGNEISVEIKYCPMCGKSFNI